MKTKLNKKFWLFAAALAFAVTLVAKPVDVKAAPAAPANLQQIDETDNAIAIKWSPVAGASKYGVQYSLDGKGWYSESFVVIESEEFYYLKAGTTYYVRVRAYDSANAPGAWSTIKVDTAPSNITTLKQTDCTGSTATVVWSGAVGATGYSVYYGPSSDPTTSGTKFYGNVGGTSAKITLGKNMANYIFVYPYRNAANAKYPASYKGGYTVGVTTPSTPKSLAPDSRSYSSKKTGFSWSPTSTVNNTDGYEFEVYMLKTNGKAKRVKKVVTQSYYTNYADIISSNLFTYPCKYRVRAYVTVNGKKKYSSWTKYSQYVPGAVCLNIKHARYGATSGTLKWKKVSGATSYTIYWKSTVNGSWKAVKKNVKGTSASVKYNGYSSNYYYVKANKVKIGSKKYNSSSLSKSLDGYVVY